jgi:hypothetical protein
MFIDENKTDILIKRVYSRVSIILFSWIGNRLEKWDGQLKNIKEEGENKLSNGINKNKYLVAGHLKLNV